MRSKLGFILTCLLTVSGAGLSAQDSTQPGQIQIEVIPLQEMPDRPMREGIDRVQRLMQLGRYAQAADLLESMAAKWPDDISLKELLAVCYEQSKNYQKLILFYRQRLATESPGYLLYRGAGEAYLMAGYPDSAHTFFYQALSAGRTNERAVGFIADIYYRFGQYKPGLDFIDSARTLMRTPHLLADKRGDALAAQKRFGEAALEYLSFMEQDTLTAREGEDKLIALMRFPESADTVMAVVSDRIKTRSDKGRLLSIYGQLLMEQKRFDDAFAFFRGRDSIDGNRGNNLIFFMQECNKRGQYAFTATAGAYILANSPQSPMMNNVHFALAEAYTATGRYEEALEEYRAVAADYVRPAHRAEANLDIGLLYKDYLADFPQAKSYLENVVKTVPGGRYDLEARMALADIAVKEREFDSAASLYQSVLEREIAEDIAERIEFSLAEIFLFKRDYQGAMTRFRQIIGRYPKGFYINDAIQYTLIIGETLSDAPSQIDLYASAEFFRYSGRADSLEYYLTRICRIDVPSLAPVSYLHLARLYFDEKRFAEALAASDSLASRYPESYYLPYGMKLKADIYLLTPQTREQALTIYRDLLEKYATYPFAAEIRNIVRRETPTGRS